MLEQKRLSTLTAALTMIAALVSCQTTGSPLIGSGPLTLAPEVESNFKSYLSLPDPLAFAVSPDGRYSGWYFCTEKSACLGVSANHEAVNYCNETTPHGSGACKVYAIGNRIVWNGKISVMAYQQAPQQAAPPSLIGRGHLALAPRVNENIVKYMKLQEPLAFAVSTDGQYNGLFYCKIKGTCQNVDAKAEALNFCQQDAISHRAAASSEPAYAGPRDPRRDRPAKIGGADCKIYALGRNVVWETPTFQTAAPSPIGSGPLAIAPRVNENIVKYMDLQEPLAFAVSTDGQYNGLFYCKVKGTCQNVDAKAEALNFCRQDAGGSGADCKIYAIGNDVVWNGRVRVAAASPQAATLQAPPPQAAPAEPVTKETLTVSDAPATKGNLRSSKAFRDLEEEIKRARQTTVGVN